MKKIFLFIMFLLLISTIVNAAMFITPESIKSIYNHELRFVADNNSGVTYYVDENGIVCSHTGIRNESCQSIQGTIKVYMSEEESCDYLDFGMNKCLPEFYKIKRCNLEREKIWINLNQECCEGLELNSEQSILKISMWDGQSYCTKKLNFFQKLWKDIKILINLK